MTIGAAALTDEMVTATDLLKAADEALYQGKRADVTASAHNSQAATGRCTSRSPTALRNPEQL